MENILDRTCSVCGCASGDILYIQNFLVPDRFPLAASESGVVTQHIVSCHGCGFVFADMGSLQKDYNDYYAKYAKYSSACSQNLDSEAPDIKDYLTNLIESVCNSDKGKKIVDIGFGSGGFLIDLKSKGFTDLHGLDIPGASASLLSQYDIKYTAGSITEENINLTESALFDVVCLISVLEHVYDVNIALSNISTMLKENGFAIVLVPDAAYYYRELINPLHQINLEHINHFDKTSLDNLMKQYGFLPHIYDKYVMTTHKISSTQMVHAYRKCAATATNEKKFNFTTEASKSVSLLIEKWKKVPVDEQVKYLVSSQEEVVIYGVGNYTYSMLSDTILKNCNIVAFVDGNPNKQGASLLGLPVYDPGFLLGFTGTIIVSVAYEPQSIIRHMTDMGLKNKTYVL